MSTDTPEYGGFNHLDMSQNYPAMDESWDDMENLIHVYSPARTAQVFIPIDFLAT